MMGRQKGEADLSEPQNWPRVELPGTAFVIPRTCPSCMAPAANEWQTGHLQQHFGGYTVYSITFYYCDACNQMLRDLVAIDEKVDEMKQGFAVSVGVTGILFAVAVAVGANSGDWGLAGAMLAGVVAVAWLFRRFRTRSRQYRETARPPLPPNAAGYGFSAYCLRARGILHRNAVFAARRREWLEKLVAANPPHSVAAR